MPSKKKYKKSEPSSTSTEYDIEPIVTDSEANDSLRKELNAAITTMGPDTPHYFSDKPSEREEYPSFNRPKTFNIEWFPNDKNVEELYKANMTISLEESESSDIEVVNNSSSSIRYDESLEVVSSKEILITPEIYRKPKDKKKLFKCQCGKKAPSSNFSNVRKKLLLNTNEVFNKNTLVKWLKDKTSNNNKNHKSDECDFYKMCITKEENDHSPPRKVVFNLVDELPKPKSTSKGVDTRHLICQNVYHMSADDEWKQGCNNNCQDNGTNESIDIVKEVGRERREGYGCSIPARVDVYYFDHGNVSYLRTTDNVPYIKSETVADKSEEYNNRFWGEIFGSIHIGTSFVTCFLLQLFRFILQDIIRPLTVGLLQLASDYFFKPCLATLFNACIQPPLICCYNICTSCRDICDPIAEGLGYFIKEIAVVCASCRLVEIRKSRCREQDYINDVNQDRNEARKCTKDKRCETII